MNNRRGRPKSGGGSIFQRNGSAFWWMRYRDREGKLQRESTGTANEQEANRLLRDRLDARDEGRLPAILAGKKLTLNQWADWFLERRSKPPFRSEKTHAENINALKFLRPAFGESPLTEVTADAIEDYIDRRLCSGRRVRTKLGTRLVGKLKPATVHQEFRILKRILNVAVKKKCLDANPCSAVEFPIQLRNATRKPHYMTASEQQRIEFSAPDYLRNAIVILAETGLRPYKELMPMKKLQVDMENRVVYIPDSKTPNGVGEMPIPDLAYRAFQAQIEATPASEYLFPTPRQQSSRPYIRSLKKIWAATLRRAGVPHFPIYELRHTFATRLSAGGVADHFVTQMLRQGDSAVFKRYSQAKLNMMREALTKLDRQANEHRQISSTARPN